MKKIFTIAIIGILITLAIGVAIIVYFRSHTEKHSNKTISTTEREEFVLFPIPFTGTFDRWTSDTEFIMHGDDQVIFFNVSTRQSRSIPIPNSASFITAGKIENCLVIVYRTEQQSVMFEAYRNSQKTAEFTLDTADVVTVGTNICVTSNHIISQPNEIATVIERFSFSGTRLEQQGVYETSYSLMPLNCRSQLILIPSNPLLSFNLFIWNSDQPQPIPVSLTEYPKMQQSNKFNHQSLTTAITLTESEVLVIENPFRNDSKQWRYSPKSPAWNVTSAKTVIEVLPKNHSVPSMHGLLIIQETGASNTKAIAEFSSPISFNDIHANPLTEAFVLISSTNDLWVLKPAP